MSRSGFTLVEVVMALLVMEIAVLGVMGTLVLASSLARRAEEVERALDGAEAVVDSLRHGASVGEDSTRFRGGQLRWSVDRDGHVVVEATTSAGARILRAETRVAPR